MGGDELWVVLLSILAISFLLPSLYFSIPICGASQVTQWVKNLQQCRKHRRCRFHPWVWKIHGGGHGNSLQYSCLENLVDRESQKAGHNWSNLCSCFAGSIWLLKIVNFLWSLFSISSSIPKSLICMGSAFYCLLLRDWKWGTQQSKPVCYFIFNLSTFAPNVFPLITSIISDFEINLEIIHSCIIRVFGKLHILLLFPSNWSHLFSFC